MKYLNEFYHTVCNITIDDISKQVVQRQTKFRETLKISVVKYI